jgi:hypothetical protein
MIRLESVDILCKAARPVESDRLLAVDEPQATAKERFGR